VKRAVQCLQVDAILLAADSAIWASSGKGVIDTKAEACPSENGAEVYEVTISGRGARKVIGAIPDGRAVSVEIDPHSRASRFYLVDGVDYDPPRVSQVLKV
jgi:hypothetical protein